MNLRVMYKTSILKLMNAFVFIDTFVLILIGVGFKGDMGIAFGIIYGLVGGIASILMFNVMIFSFIMMKSRPRVGTSPP